MPWIEEDQTTTMASRARIGVTVADHVVAPARKNREVEPTADVEGVDHPPLEEDLHVIGQYRRWQAGASGIKPAAPPSSR
jgi:hypothetical protein